MKEYAIFGYLDKESTQKIYEIKEYLFTSNFSDYILTSPVAHLTFCDFKSVNDTLFHQLKVNLESLYCISLRSRGLNTFPNSSIIFLEPEKTKELTQIHTDIFKIIEPIALSSHYDIKHWYPHITIANRIPLPHYQRCMDYCKQSLDMDDMTIDKICIIEFDIMDSIIQSQKIIHTTYLK